VRSSLSPAAGAADRSPPVAATVTRLREMEQRLSLRFEQLERRIDTMVNRIVAAVVIALGALFGALHYWPPNG